MYRIQAWNAMGCKQDEPSPPMELKQALTLACDFHKRGLRRITLIDMTSGEAVTDLEHLLGDPPEAEAKQRLSGHHRGRRAV